MTRHKKEEVIKAARDMKPGGLRGLDAGSYEVSAPDEEEEPEECALCIAEMQGTLIDSVITSYIAGFMASLAVSLDDPMQHEVLKFCKKHHERIGEAYQCSLNTILSFISSGKKVPDHG